MLSLLGGRLRVLYLSSVLYSGNTKMGGAKKGLI